MSSVTDTEALNLTHDIQEFTYFMRDIYCNACACDAFKTLDGRKCPAGFEQIVIAIASMPTTRTILLISDGLNRFLGRELYSVLSGFAPGDRRFGFNPRDNNDRLQNILKIAVNKDIRFTPLTHEAYTQVPLWAEAHSMLARRWVPIFRRLSIPIE